VKLWKDQENDEKKKDFSSDTMKNCTETICA
jgi:hypothetical protein